MYLCVCVKEGRLFKVFKRYFLHIWSLEVFKETVFVGQPTKTEFSWAIYE